MFDVEAVLFRRAVLPVIVIDDVADAAPLGKALVEGGLPLAEVTFRTAAAASAIKILGANSEMTVGAGTVLTVSQADAAIDAGAAFIVTPGLDEEIVKHCLARDFPIFPGVLTPTELTHAVRLGLECVKVFPVGPLGGASYLKAVSAPFGAMRYMPTGGLTEESLPDLLAMESVLCCGGSWIAPKRLLASGDFAEISRRARGASAFSRE